MSQQTRSDLRQVLVGAMLALIAATGAWTAQQAFEYPATRRGEAFDIYHSVRIEDPYRWLEDASAPATSAWVAAQNQLTEAYLDAVPFRRAVQARYVN